MDHALPGPHDKATRRGADMTTPLRIALLAPLVAPISQPYLGGAQAVIRDLAVALAAHGHDVTLFGATGSDPDILPHVHLVEIDIDPARVRPADFGAPSTANVPLPDDSAVAEAFERAYALIDAASPAFDIVHAHAYDAPSFIAGQDVRPPVVHTLHMSALDPHIVATLRALAPPGSPEGPRGPRQPWLTTVSHACAATYRHACRIDAVIYNGADISAIPFGAAARQPPYLLFAGRMSPEKGVVDAIQVALAADARLVMAGGVYDQRYYDEAVRPLIERTPDQITYLGPLPRERVWELMAGAMATLMPSHWDEPFGLVACEAQAAGSPVVAYLRGGLPEVIADGVTGALVAHDDSAAAAAALPRVYQLDRAACRTHVERHFTIPTMLAAYERLYAHILAISGR